MSSENAMQEGRPQDGSNDAELDQAIDELRGVLKKGTDPSGSGAAAARVGTEARGGAGKGSEFDEMSMPSGKAFAQIDDFGADEEAASVDPAPHAGGADARLDLIMDIPIDVEIVLGTSRMPVSALMNLSEGSTIALERRIGEPVEITVNGRVIGHGEITVLEDDESRFGVRLLDVATGKG